MKNCYGQKRHYREVASLDVFLFQPISNKFIFKQTIREQTKVSGIDELIYIFPATDHVDLAALFDKFKKDKKQAKPAGISYDRIADNRRRNSVFVLQEDFFSFRF